MPEVRLEPVNQCFVDGSSTEEEPATTVASAPPPTADASGAATDAGTDALVRRFDAERAGARDTGLPPCLADELKAVVACGTALATVETPAFYWTALNCIASVIAVEECLTAESTPGVE